jgi:hypothetical protein
MSRPDNDRKQKKTSFSVDRWFWKAGRDIAYDFQKVLSLALFMILITCTYLTGQVVNIPDEVDGLKIRDWPICVGESDYSLYVGHGETCILLEDWQCDTVIVEYGGILETRGYTLRVCDILINYGEITDSYSGGAGGAGGEGGRGSDPNGSGPDNGEPGDPGQPGLPGDPPDCAGSGGRGGGGGGGGGGVLWQGIGGPVDANGGDGGDGGDGGKGGGCVRIYAREFDNQGLIHADGEDGEPGDDGRDGEYFSYGVPLKDVAGGGGGGGGGGYGGDGGTVEICFAFLLNEGQIESRGGNGGDGGRGGDGHRLHYLRWTGLYSRFSPGDGGWPYGGDGGWGEFRKDEYSEDGEDGRPGLPGDDGEVDIDPIFPIHLQRPI